MKKLRWSDRDGAQRQNANSNPCYLLLAFRVSAA